MAINSGLINNYSAVGYTTLAANQSSGMVFMDNTVSKVTITGDDILIGNMSLTETLRGMQSRLLILDPKPELLAKYEALQQAYNHYKTLEALLVEEQK